MMKFINYLILSSLIALFVVGLIIFSNHQQQSQQSQANPKGQKLLIICLDGVRHDHVNWSHLDAFSRLAAAGSRAEFNTPIFPTNSYPNLYTIVTGLYAESHGIVDNKMYDPFYNDLFVHSPALGSSQSHWWDQAEPIWIRAEKAGIRTAAYNWDGCQINFDGRTSKFCTHYRDIDRWPTFERDSAQAARFILKQFKSDELGLGLFYWKLPDQVGHFWGPDSDDMHRAMIRTNDFLKSVLNDIVELGLSSTVNVYVVSTHGMAPKSTKRIYLLDELGTNTTDNWGILWDYNRGTHYSVVAANQTYEQLIYESLMQINTTGINVYRRHQIPDSLHYRNNRLTPSVLVIAQPDYLIDWEHGIDSIEAFGYHGYPADYYPDSRLMDGITFAMGPAFKAGHKLETVVQTDHYQVFCKILGLDPKPHNGSWDRVKNMFR